MRPNAITLATIVALSAVVACGRDGAPWQVGGDHIGSRARPMPVSTTTITAVEIGRPIGVTDDARYVYGLPRPQTVGKLLATAHGDLANLDARIDRLEYRASTVPASAPDRDRWLGELREMRGAREAIAQDLDAMKNAPRAEWPARRGQLDSDWDALLTRVDDIADAIPPTP